MVSWRLVEVSVTFVRIDDVLLEVCAEPGEVVDLGRVLPDPLSVLQPYGVVALVAAVTSTSTSTAKSDEKKILSRNSLFFKCKAWDICRSKLSLAIDYLRVIKAFI
jgi:hypothetical protein